MGRHHHGRSGGYYYSGRSTSLFHRSRVYGYGDSDSVETEELLKSLQRYTSVEEYLASLPTHSRCEIYARYYEAALRRPDNLDAAANAKRELLKCPERFIKVMKKIENSSSKLSGDKTWKCGTVEEYLAQLSLDDRCSVLTIAYEKAVLGYKDPDDAAKTKRQMAGCPERYFKKVSEIDKFSAKLNS